MADTREHETDTFPLPPLPAAADSVVAVVQVHARQSAAVQRHFW